MADKARDATHAAMHKTQQRNLPHQNANGKNNKLRDKHTEWSNAKQQLSFEASVPETWGRFGIVICICHYYFIKLNWVAYILMVITSVTKQKDCNNITGTKKEINRSAKKGEILIWNCICTIKYVCLYQLNSIYSAMNQKKKIKDHIPNTGKA